MILKPDSIKKIKAMGEASAVGNGFVDIFESAARSAEFDGSPNATIVAQLYTEESDLQPGDYAPELHFVVRRIEEVEDGNLEAG